ncbi:gamma-glutamylcyclotransferase [Halogeometricum salsisoli]
MPPFFVYGTLTDSVQVARLLNEWSFGPDARVDGLHRAEGRYPTLAPGGSVSGRLLETDETATLDTYEGVDSGLYVRVELPRADGGSAYAYVGDAGRLNADAEWPGEGDLRTRVERYLSENSVVVEPRESG